MERYYPKFDVTGCADEIGAPILKTVIENEIAKLEGNNVGIDFSILNWGSIKTRGRDAQ